MAVNPEIVEDGIAIIADIRQGTEDDREVTEDGQENTEDGREVTEDGRENKADSPANTDGTTKKAPSPTCC